MSDNLEKKGYAVDSFNFGPHRREAVVPGENLEANYFAQRRIDAEEQRVKANLQWAKEETSKNSSGKGEVDECFNGISRKLRESIDILCKTPLLKGPSGP